MGHPVKQYHKMLFHHRRTGRLDKLRRADDDIAERGKAQEEYKVGITQLLTDLDHILTIFPIIHIMTRIYGRRFKFLYDDISLNHDVVLQTFIWPSDLVLMTVERSVSLTTGFLVSYIPSHPIDVLLSVPSSMQYAPRKPDVIFPPQPDGSVHQYLYLYPIQYPRSFLSLCNQEMHQGENTHSLEKHL